jgi:hypothetical protein
MMKHQQKCSVNRVNLSNAQPYLRGIVGHVECKLSVDMMVVQEIVSNVCSRKILTRRAQYLSAQ